MFCATVSEQQLVQCLYVALKSMEKFFVVFQSGKDWKKIFGLLVWKKKIIFHTWSFDIHFHDILLKIDIILLISC